MRDVSECDRQLSYILLDDHQIAVYKIKITELRQQPLIKEWRPAGHLSTSVTMPRPSELVCEGTMWMAIAQPVLR